MKSREKTDKTTEKRYYVLQYSVDQDDICIKGGPWTKNKAKEFAKILALDKLESFGIAANRFEAACMYRNIESGKSPIGDMDYISVYENGATVRYGDSETKWQIVKYQA